VNIVIVGGLCVESDAISAALLSQAEMIDGFAESDNVSIVTQFCNRSTDLDVFIVGDSWSFLRLPVVAQADLVIFHWGIEYALFDALLIVATTTRTIVHFHNVTPPDLVDNVDRLTIERSLRQIQLVDVAPCAIWTESEFNAVTLTTWGVDRARITFMPFPIEAPRPIRRGPPSGPIRLLTIGRLVRAKGVDVLVQAMGKAVEQLEVPVVLTFVGNPSFSDRDFLFQLEQSIDQLELRKTINIVPDANDDALWELLEQADIVVSPSLHEGLCVPVVEGYIAGCRIVASDAGNLPFVVQSPDPTVPAGNVDALADAIVTMVHDVAGNRSFRPAGSDALVELYSSASTLRHLSEALDFHSDD
jgi:glycosyltransferase involved in cell wall biosynthesis